MGKSLNRIKMQLAQLDKENKWKDLDRDEIIDQLIYEEIKAASFELDYEGVGRMVHYLIKVGETLR